MHFFQNGWVTPAKLNTVTTHLRMCMVTTKIIYRSPPAPRPPHTLDRAVVFALVFDPSGPTGMEVLFECLPWLALTQFRTGFWKFREVWAERPKQMSSVKSEEYFKLLKQFWEHILGAKYGLARCLSSLVK